MDQHIISPLARRAQRAYIAAAHAPQGFDLGLVRKKRAELLGRSRLRDDAEAFTSLRARATDDLRREKGAGLLGALSARTPSFERKARKVSRSKQVLIAEVCRLLLNLLQTIAGNTAGGARRPIRD
jgi:hypothetical protein